ncbi:MAG: NrdH-redoxin [Methanosarcinaceae archaeon]|nr:NrdH-redoxin [Methanosarcinaceae archaeon]
MLTIIIYTTEVCPRCNILKKYFDSKNISYKEEDMASVDSLTELAMNNIFTNAAPVLKIGDDFFTSDKLFKEMNVNESLIESYIESNK